MYKLFASICVLSLALTVRANEVIVNGGFETGDFTGWTVTDSPGGTGSFFVAGGTNAPLSGNTTVGPRSGNFYAVSDQFGPGTHVITQSFTAAANTGYLLSFYMFVNDYATAFGADTQYGGEADLIAGGANPLLAPMTTQFYYADTQVIGGIPNPYVHTSLDITGDVIAGNTYQLRFLESDSTSPLNVGVDDVSLIATSTSTVPEPKLLFFPLALLAGIVVYQTRRKAQAQS